MDEAITMARKAAEAESNLPYAFGPPFPIKPSYELLAELLLKQNHPHEAPEDALRQALLRAPNRTQSLALLERASAASRAAANNSASSRDAAQNKSHRPKAMALLQNIPV